jgi:hypothetical protein
VLANQYYTRLKEFVKDELTRINKPNNLKDIIKKAIRINNCFHERSLEKKNHIVSGKNKETSKRNRETL